jgi:hypothetical protein
MHETIPSPFEAPARSVLRQAAHQAVKAPSIHNTQPWRFVVADNRLDIAVDGTRRLDVLDPRGRQLMISCGCALLNARVAIAAQGYEPVVERCSSVDVNNVVARLRLGAERPAGREAELNQAIERRRTNRRPFRGEGVSIAEVARLNGLAQTEDADLVNISTDEERRLVAELLAKASRLEAEDPAYLRELLAWTTDDPDRQDGVHASTVPFAGGAGQSGAGTAVRRFDLHGTGWLPSAAPLTEECVLLLCTAEDGPDAWLRAGEALELVWLELTAIGLSASPIGQVVEVRGTRDRMRRELGLRGYPQLVLRVGRALAPPSSRRRSPSDVIVEM